MNYNEQLQQLQEKVFTKKKLEAKLNELRNQQKDLENRVKDLEKIMLNEQADVDRLEHTNLISVFYALVGKKAEMLDKEKVEAYEAKVKHDSVTQELIFVEEDIHSIEEQLAKISDCELLYEELLCEKTTAIKTSGSVQAQLILELEQKITAQKSQKMEIGEAIAAGSCALKSASSVLSRLESAEGWGTWDLFGGGLISDLAKHSHLDEAQNKVKQLQTELRRFKTELADVTIQADMQVNVDGFLRFADYFFDGLFADWTVLNKISQSKSSIESTKSKIENVLSRLRSMETECNREIKKLEAQKDAVVVKATL